MMSERQVVIKAHNVNHHSNHTLTNIVKLIFENPSKTLIPTFLPFAIHEEL